MLPGKGLKNKSLQAIQLYKQKEEVIFYSQLSTYWVDINHYGAEKIILKYCIKRLRASERP